MRIPVPLRVKDEAERVVQFFQRRLENNLDAYTAVVPDDQPISLFGKDSFCGNGYTVGCADVFFPRYNLLMIKGANGAEREVLFLAGPQTANWLSSEIR